MEREREPRPKKQREQERLGEESHSNKESISFQAS